MKAALLDKLRTLRSFTTLIVLFVGGGSIYILPYLSSYFYIPMKDAMHLSNMQIGLMGSAMGFTSMVFYWPGGWMADRFSPRKLIAFSMIANGLLGFWLATIPSFKVLLAIQLLMGAFLTLTRHPSGTDRDGHGLDFHGCIHTGCLCSSVSRSSPRPLCGGRRRLPLFFPDTGNLFHCRDRLDPAIPPPYQRQGPGSYLIALACPDYL